MKIFISFIREKIFDIYLKILCYYLEVASNGPGVSGPAELQKQSLNIVSVLSDPYTMVKLDTVSVGRSSTPRRLRLLKYG